MKLPVIAYRALDKNIPGQHITYGDHGNSEEWEWYARCTRPILASYKNGTRTHKFEVLTNADFTYMVKTDYVKPTNLQSIWKGLKCISRFFRVSL
jgi:hypothetical protein